MIPAGTALREALADGYRSRDLRSDLMAGAVVGIVALPLSMALAIASGVPPQHGLYTAIVAGLLIALLGGSRFQVSGPTAAFVVVLAPIAAKYGVGGLLLATVMAGVMLVIAGIAGLGQLIEFVPYPVTTGFTAGIAVVIGTIQVKDFLGLGVPDMPAHYVERVVALARALPTAQWSEFLVGLLTLGVLLLWPRVTRKIPSPLVALALAAVAAAVAERFVPGFRVESIADRFSYDAGGVLKRGIPQLPPLPHFPWNLPGPGGAAVPMSFDLLRTLAMPAFAIAVLGAIESLLSAAAADGMKGTHHDPDAELVAQGMGNMIAPFFGGIAATGAIARTATNVRSGARSPFAAVIHSVFVLLAVLAAAPLLGYLPMSALAALLLVVAWNMAEARHAVRLVREMPRPDVLVFLTCFGLTVVFDMVIAVTAGVLLSTLLFIRRMSAVVGVQLASKDHPAHDVPLPHGVVVYEIAGPLFFGAAQKAIGALRVVGEAPRVVVLDLRSVPAIDATGLRHLDTALERFTSAGATVVLAGLQKQPARALVKAGWRGRERLIVTRSLERGLARARDAAVQAGAPSRSFAPA